MGFTPTKTPCPVSRKQFRSKASAIVAQIGTVPFSVAPKEFKPQPGASFGSMGFYANGQMTVIIDGVPCKATVGITITLANSKEVSE